jgi:hypothetical protein
MAKKTTKTTETATENKHLVAESEVDFKTRTVLLLDSRNDLVAYFFGGLDVMAANYKPKGKEKFGEFVYITCRGFIETVREKSMTIMAEFKPEYGIGDIIKNTKGQTRFIINMFKDPKTKELDYAWVDPNDAKAPMGVCSAKTLGGWVEKY